MIRKFPTKSRCPSCDPHAKGQLGRMGAERKTKKSPKCQLCKGKLLIPVRIAQKYLAVMNGEEVETTSNPVVSKPTKTPRVYRLDLDSLNHMQWLNLLRANLRLDPIVPNGL